MNSRTCSESSCHDMDHGEAYPRLTALCRFLVILAETTKLHQPTESALDHPSARQHHKAFDIIGSFHDLQHPTSKSRHPSNKLTGVPAVSPDEPKTRERSQQLLQDQLGAVSILDTGAVHDHSQQQSQRIYRNMAFAPFDLLARIVAIVPPFCVVFTDWVSMIAAEGVGSWPLCTLTFSRKTSWTRSIVPFSRQRQKCSHTLVYGGKSCGR